MAEENQQHLAGKGSTTSFESFAAASSPEHLTRCPVPTHLIVSNSLRLSSSFEIYRRVLSSRSVPDIYIPHELPAHAGEPDVDGLRSMLSVFRGSPALRTLVVSEPYKCIIMSLLDYVDPRATDIGAVNLVTKREDKLIGDNLDGMAFALAVKKELGISFDRKAMIFFGCGGISSAVAINLAKRLAKVALIDVSFDRTLKLRDKLLALNPKLRVFVADRSEELDLRGFEYFYNGTGLGKNSANENSVLLTPLHAFDELPERGVAFDANYMPWESAFLRRFSTLDFMRLNGFSHMIAFASLHLSIITGGEVSYETVREHAAFALPSGVAAWQ